MIGDRAFDAGLPIHALVPTEVSLEEAFMRMTHDAVEYGPADLSVSHHTEKVLAR